MGGSRGAISAPALRGKEPNVARAHSNLGVSLVGLGRIDEALEQFQTAARLDPAHSGQAGGFDQLDAAYAETGHFAGSHCHRPRSPSRCLG